MSEIAPVIANAEGTWGRTPLPADTLAAARQYVYTHCPPAWLRDVIDALFGDDA